MIEGNSTRNSTCPGGSNDLFGRDRPRAFHLQIAISAALGIGAFLAFCFLRPRWKGLYSARKKQNNLATALPDLPDSFFGWIIPLWRITDEQVLASAGLDAYVYLAFFKMAIKFLLVTLFFALAVIKPVHDTHQDKEGKKSPIGKKPSQDRIEIRSTLSTFASGYEQYTDYLWMYLVFVYLFTALIMYLIVSETRRIIDVRQEYLGSQTTITDRTIRLSGIPVELRSEDKIKDFIMDLGIGKVESVTLCRNWKEIDNKVVERQAVLRKLEEAWTVHLGSRSVERSLETLPMVQPHPPQHTENSGNEDSETSHFLSDAERDPGHISPYAQQRPTAKIWYGRFKLRYKRVDAIDYYEEKLRRLDDEVRALRKKEFEPTPLAFVTMDSVASAQMAIQAVLDPSPLQLLAHTSPAPQDVVWSNTYLSRGQRMFRSWSITIAIGILSVFWTVLFVPIAGALNTCSIREVLPSLANLLHEHPNLEILFNNQLPTLAVSLINVLVPFLYDWLANKQGMISQGDVELSVISKNFFFVFFNFFILFTILGTASNFLTMLEQFAEKLTSATQIAYALATSLSNLLGFYTNFMILQGFGLFPFRLLEFGALSLYPVYLIGAKTPRDYAELVQPPVFSYGFFLPQTILIFIICIVYSVLQDSWMVLLTGLAYFMIGHFVHKYQLLYAMEHRQHSTGKGWTMMCDRVLVGVVLFQITVAGQLALKKAFKRAVMVAPLVVCTLWFLVVFARTYRPLMKFIALRSLRSPEQSELGRDVQEEAVANGQAGRLTLDEAPVHLRFGGASITSSQIYLSRGVAETKSEPALSILTPEPLQVDSFFKSSTTRRSSLAPPRPRRERMSHAMDFAVTTPLLTDATITQTNQQQEATPNSTSKAQSPDPRRSEVLRHVFPRPSRTRIPHSGKTLPRVTKADRSDTALASRLQSRPRVAFHKYITSLFGSVADRNVVADSPEARSRASSFGSRPGSSLYGSVPSLDMVSPATFMFSGPSLRSVRSYSDSMSRLPSLAETNSDVQLLRRAQTDSFSMLDSASIIEDAILEPGIDQGITRTVTDVLLGVRTPSEEDESPFILQHVYDYLSPKDSNAVRHTCRHWMRASLDKNLLNAMLSRGGWLSSTENTTCATHGAASHSITTAVSHSEEWSLSRYLCRQCALSSGWTGNGLDTRAAIVERSGVDFTELANGYASGLVFSTSLCGRFVCVARETLIYIYNLESGLPVPITSVLCPRRVIEVSMDVSSSRHAIAALLEGRMGLVCELQYGRTVGGNGSVDVHVDVDGPEKDVTTSASIQTRCINDYEAGMSLRGRNTVRMHRPFVQERDPATFDTIGVRSNNQRINLQNTDDHQTHDQHFINHVWNLNISGPSRGPSAQGLCTFESCVHTVPVERGTTTIYRHLCAEDDPPRSVSICPQRRCVAFGCSAGIELHWIDALTGQSLSRDHLYFLSPRPGFESAKKLRLISSAAHPEDRPAISRKFFGRPTMASFWGSFGFESATHRPGSTSCDHYHALPLSDGYHVLFNDPVNGRLTLGCDAPLGGPTKLLRKITFTPPEQNAVPRLYSVAADLSQGVRAIVAYGDTLLLYSVPPDVWDEPFPSSQPKQRNGEDSSSIWPLAIGGTEIARLSDVCELAIQTQPEVLIWAFTHTSKCKTWRLHNYVDPVLAEKRHVCRNGIIHGASSIDESGDVVMTDAPQASHVCESINHHVIGDEIETLQAERSLLGGFDGNASGVLKKVPKALAVENDEWVDYLDVRGCLDARYDADGDVMMLYGS
ncbi:hypothetical protein BKA58DRAFT_430749 [Alternaria rosae]|uniref:uncharacterized protein n=1 Tax=Alternaria rosae TaxID=1187941 RepID=UPI001E8DF7B1|nr:uncharacterized protein BKA58DRAFT_430749 [Alternaria rosae]KAH6866878.1 hypothetical protein BKA58DRAFT_430749 [Alternaria rosae]